MSSREVCACAAPVPLSLHGDAGDYGSGSDAEDGAGEEADVREAVEDRATAANTAVSSRDDDVNGSIPVKEPAEPEEHVDYSGSDAENG